MEIKKIVLAYSGGLDTACILNWLKDKYHAEIVAYIADVGQTEDIDEIKQKAHKTGAKEVRVVDLKEEFAKDYVFEAVRANAVYESGYLLGTALARPIIAEYMVHVAKETGANAVSHGSTGKGNDQVRFDLGVKALAPELKIIAPWREWEYTSRSQLIEYAKTKGIPVTTTAEKPYSMDANLMHISYEGGILEDPWNEPPADMFRWTKEPRNCSDNPEYCQIGFENGIPVSVNNEKLSPLALMNKVNEIGARNGVGRVDLVENRFIGIKSRGVYETPGATLLHIAHRALESLTLDREVMRMKDSLSHKFAELVYCGFWFSPEMDLLKKFIAESQTRVTGEVKLKLFKGNATLVGRKSPYSLYKTELSSFDTTPFNPKDSEGFININSLRLQLYGKSQERSK